jgi:hypothetical protein
LVLHARGAELHPVHDLVHLVEGDGESLGVGRQVVIHDLFVTIVAMEGHRRDFMSVKPTPGPELPPTALVPRGFENRIGEESRDLAGKRRLPETGVMVGAQANTADSSNKAPAVWAAESPSASPTAPAPCRQ